MTLLLDRYHHLKSDIVSAYSLVSSRERHSPPELMVVTKNQSVETILPLLEAGHRFFGENRVQEAQEKWPLLKARYPDVRLHLIGSLQRNKVSQALSLFDGIETIDRLSLLAEIILVLKKNPLSSFPLFLIQVNVGDEPQKAGVSKDDFHGLYEACLKAQLPLQGLMCIPPHKEDPGIYFEYLRGLADQYNLPVLSMGMSGDFKEAIRWGTSWVRIGTALFGSS